MSRVAVAGAWQAAFESEKQANMSQRKSLLVSFAFASRINILIKAGQSLPELTVYEKIYLPDFWCVRTIRRLSRALGSWHVGS